jgi:hypothetical protein
MNPGRDEEIAAAVGAHSDLGPGYDDAIAAGLVERIGAEVDRRVDERMSQYLGGGRPGADGGFAASRQAQHLPAFDPGSQISWQQVGLAIASMVVGLIASVSINIDNGKGTWPIIVIWLAIVCINTAIFRTGRPARRDRRPPQ